MGSQAPDLSALEDEFRQRLAGYRIVFEMSLDDDTVERARAAIAHFAVGKGQPERELRKKYPRVLLAYVVGSANRNYRPPALWDTLPLQDLDESDLKLAVEGAIGDLGLE